MRYRVTYLERTNAAGEPSESPQDYVEVQLNEGVILDKAMVQLQEDDSFQSIGSETWDYEIANGREKEFLNAVTNSRMAFECLPIDGPV